MTTIKNQGDVTAYVPTDTGGAYPLEPGDTVDVRPGTAEFAANNIPGVVYAPEPTLAQRHAIAEASTAAAIEPLAAFIEANPGTTRYAAVGDAYGVPGEVTVVDATAIDPVVEAPDTSGDPITVQVPAGTQDAETVEVQTAASTRKRS